MTELFLHPLADRGCLALQLAGFEVALGLGLGVAVFLLLLAWIARKRRWQGRRQRPGVNPLTVAAIILLALGGLQVLSFANEEVPVRLAWNGDSLHYAGCRGLSKIEATLTGEDLAFLSIDFRRDGRRGPQSRPFLLLRKPQDGATIAVPLPMQPSPDALAAIGAFAPEAARVYCEATNSCPPGDADGQPD